MRRCICDSLTDELWKELVDEVTLRHGFTRVTYRQVFEGFTTDNWATARLIGRIEKMPIRDVLDTAASQCNLPVAKDLFDEAFEKEIVPIGAVIDRALAAP